MKRWERKTLKRKGKAQKVGEAEHNLHERILQGQNTFLIWRQGAGPFGPLTSALGPFPHSLLPLAP